METNKNVMAKEDLVSRLLSRKEKFLKIRKEVAERIERGEKPKSLQNKEQMLMRIKDKLNRIKAYSNYGNE